MDAKASSSNSDAVPIGLNIAIGLWVFVCLWLTREYMILNHWTKGASVLQRLHQHGLLLKGEKLTTEAGGTLSYRLGWLGFGVILLTNAYILRKHVPFLANKGRLENWLNWHIAFGVIGPTLIVLHTNFRVHGLVAISYWSMMTSFGSGIVGRYFYTQIIKDRAELEKSLDGFESTLDTIAARPPFQLDQHGLLLLKHRAFAFAGGLSASGDGPLLSVLAAAFLGDLRLMLGHPPTPRSLRALRKPLKSYGLLRRRLTTVTQFRQLIGYWHSFHMPFAVFMYVVTIIHIIAAMVFKVKH